MLSHTMPLSYLCAKTDFLFILILFISSHPVPLTSSRSFPVPSAPTTDAHKVAAEKARMALAASGTGSAAFPTTAVDSTSGWKALPPKTEKTEEEKAAKSEATAAALRNARKAAAAATASALQTQEKEVEKAVVTLMQGEPQKLNEANEEEAAAKEEVVPAEENSQEPKVTRKDEVTKEKPVEEPKTISVESVGGWKNFPKSQPMTAEQKEAKKQSRQATMNGEYMN